MEKSAVGQGVVFLRGRKTILRPSNKETDQALLCKWINDPEVRQYLQVYKPITFHQEGEFLESHGKNDSRIFFIIETLEGKAIGVMSLEQIDWKDRRATTGTLIGEKEYWNKGYGRDAKMALLKYAFGDLNLHKICSGAMCFNERSLRYSLACGYRVEGRLEKHVFRNGRYHDQILLAIFRKSWQKAYDLYMAQDLK